MRKVKNILLFILTLLPIVTFGQSRNVHERVYISTDKGSYVSGEGIGCAVYCFQLEGGNLSLSGLSSVAYLELVSSQGVVLLSFLKASPSSLFFRLPYDSLQFACPRLQVSAFPT